MGISDSCVSKSLVENYAIHQLIKLYAGIFIYIYAVLQPPLCTDDLFEHGFIILHKGTEIQFSGSKPPVFFLPSIRDQS